MRKGGTAVSRLVITVLTKGPILHSFGTETEAILTVNLPRADFLTIEHRRAMTGILTAAARQDSELTKIDQAVTSMVTAITIHTVVPVKVSEEEILVILIVVVMEELMVREVRIPMVVEAEVLMVGVGEVDKFMAAVVEAMTLTVVVAAVMGVTVPLEMTKIIRAITRWYPCLEHRETAPDQDAARPSVSPRRDRGDHQE